MHLHHTITLENIEKLVKDFYYKALRDDLIGHYFTEELGEDLTSKEWVKHIDILIDFWATVFLDELRYKSDPYGPHFTIVGLCNEDFERWVALFVATVESIYEPNIANAFIQRAQFYAKVFKEKLHIGIDNNNLKSSLNWE